MSTPTSLVAELPRIVTEMGFSIDHALASIRAAVKIAEHTGGDVGLAWKKGLEDALLILKPVQDSNERLKKWIDEADRQMIAAGGVTKAERDGLY